MVKQSPLYKENGMNILLILTVALAVGTLNVVCFLFGAKVGQKVVKGEPIETPNLNPVKAYREREARLQVEREINKLDTIMQNIETYDGTGNGQKDVR
jgi:hypothetical protein